MVYLFIIATLNLLLTAYIGYRYFVKPPKVSFKAEEQELLSVMDKANYRRKRVEYGESLNNNRFGDKPKAPEFPQNRTENGGL